MAHSWQREERWWDVPGSCWEGELDPIAGREYRDMQSYFHEVDDRFDQEIIRGYLPDGEPHFRARIEDMGIAINSLGLPIDSDLRDRARVLARHLAKTRATKITTKQRSHRLAFCLAVTLVRHSEGWEAA